MRLLPALLLLLLTPQARATDPGISRALAQSRAARLSDLRYNLAFTLTPKSPTTEGHEVLTFTLAPGPQQDLAIDFRDGTLQSATLNAKPIPTTTENGHLTLPAVALHAGPNTLSIDFTANIAPAGKAITRYTDKDDGREYLYTLFVPMDADMAFPCFDQPDLKARFTLSVTHPADWQVIGNTTPASTSPTVASFPETRPISTYLFAFAAGSFARIPGQPSEPTVYVRQSQLKKAQAEAPQLQQITAQGINYFADYFQQPFPFPKYDLVLIPGFPFGGMEHAGATFLNEDGVLFRTAPTASDRFRRNTLTLHELAHQWFGDLVTMRWFDDLWLKEGFAQYMAYKALAELDPASNPWKHFAEDIKPLAYAIDETQGTTPIFQQIPNLLDAKSAYGAIVYQKAPAVLKQLNFRLGDDVFRNGLRLYLRDHAYANAQWADLIHAFEQAGGKDVQPWADAWITHRGMPEVDVSFTCNGPRLHTITLRQHDVLGTSFVWPISNLIYLNFPPQPKDARPLDFTYSLEPIRVDWNRPGINMESFHVACPTYIFANSGDQSYGRFLLDRTSEAAVTQTLGRLASSSESLLGGPALSSATPTPQIQDVATQHEPDPLLKTQLWSALWDNVRAAQTPPGEYAALALKTLPSEQDESLARVQGARIATCLHEYLGPTTRKTILLQAERTLSDRMLHAPTLGLRIVSFRTFVAVAESYQALSELKQMIAGTLTIPGFEFQRLDRWTMVGHLIVEGEPEAQVSYNAIKTGDTSGEAQKYAYAAVAGTPAAATKQQYFADYLRTSGPGTVQEDWLTQSLRPFNSWNQTELTEPYLKKALDALPSIKANRKIFFLGAWLSAFIEGQHSPEAQAAVHTWLAQPNIDPDLRRKVLEVSDELDRTVKIRSTWPD